MDDQHPHRPAQPSRRGFLSLATALGTATALGGLPAFTATAAPVRPAVSPMLSPGATTRMWYRAPAGERKMIQQGLPVGNGRLGALVGGDPARELVYVTDGTLWTGGLQRHTRRRTANSLTRRASSARFTQLDQLALDIPDHDPGAVTDYRRSSI